MATEISTPVASAPRSRWRTARALVIALTVLVATIWLLRSVGLASSEGGQQALREHAAPALERRADELQLVLYRREFGLLSHRTSAVFTVGSDAALRWASVELEQPWPFSAWVVNRIESGRGSYFDTQR